MTEELTNDQKFLLLHLEARLVDDGGEVNIDHINSEEMQQLENWAESDFIKVRTVSSSINLFIKLSDQAWEIAQKERREKSKRMLSASFEKGESWSA